MIRPAKKKILGLDIGGANLKAAHSEGVAHSEPFALWKNPEQLSERLRQICQRMPDHDGLAVTMTGELCDCFATRSDGVRAILQNVREAAGPTPIHVWTTHGRFLEPAQASDVPLVAAAANWLALAYFVGRRYTDERVVLIDTGSTTTDIVYLNRGAAEPRGLTDYERLKTGELVYTGVRRTPICAVLGMQVAAEFFATMLDAYLLMEKWPETPSDGDTADGRPATRNAAHARMARMKCADGETLSLEETTTLAQLAIRHQCQTVAQALERVLAGRPNVDRLVIAGSGDVLGRTVAEEPRWSAVPVTLLSEVLGPALSEAACAYAVATLACEE